MEGDSMDVDQPDLDQSTASGRDLFYRVACDLAPDNAWLRELPRHERQVVDTALKSERTWRALFGPNHEDDGSDGGFTKSQASTNPTGQKRKRTATATKRAKSTPSKKRSDKKGVATPEEGEESETNFLDVFNSRVRCLVFDALVDRLFPAENYTTDPWAETIKISNAPSVNPESFPFWTLDDSTDGSSRQDLDESMDESSIPEISLDGIRSSDGAPPPRKMAKLTPTIITPSGAVRPGRSFDKLESVAVPTEFKALLMALDYVVTTLREYTPHSTPFLRPVLKTEAPSYFDVIKNPMDLGTLGTKLEELKYFSKFEFSVDLDLIFTNCRIFNDPTSIYVLHADELEKLARLLMQRIPDYDYRHERARVLAELAALETPDAMDKARAALTASSASAAAAAADPDVSRLQFYAEDPILTRLHAFRWSQLQSPQQQPIAADQEPTQPRTEGNQAEENDEHSLPPIPTIDVRNLPAFQIHPASRLGCMEALRAGDFSMPLPLRRIVNRNKQFFARLRNKEVGNLIGAPAPSAVAAAPAATPAPSELASSAAPVVKDDPASSTASASAVPATPGAPAPLAATPVKSEPAGDAMQVDSQPAAPSDSRPVDGSASLPSAGELSWLAPGASGEEEELQLNDELCNELLRHSVGIESALHGFDRVNELALDILTSATELFMERVGVLIKSFVDVPGTKSDMIDCMQNAFSELLPHGMLTLRDYVVQDTYKFNNRLQNVPQSELEKWLKMSGRSAADSAEVTVGSLYREYFLQFNPMVKVPADATKMLQQLPPLGIIQAPAHVTSNLSGSASAVPQAQPPAQQAPPPQAQVAAPPPAQYQAPVAPQAGQMPPQYAPPVVQQAPPPRAPPQHMPAQDMHSGLPESHSVAPPLPAANRPKKPPMQQQPPMPQMPPQQQPQTQHPPPPQQQPQMMPGQMGPDMGQPPRPASRGPGRPPRANFPNAPAGMQQVPQQMPPQQPIAAPQPHPQPVQHSMGGPQLVHHGAPLNAHMAPQPHVPPQNQNPHMMQGAPMRSPNDSPMMHQMHQQHHGEDQHDYSPHPPRTPQTPGGMMDGMEGDDGGRSRRRAHRQHFGDYLTEEDDLSGEFDESEDKKKKRKAAGRGTPARKK